MSCGAISLSWHDHRAASGSQHSLTSRTSSIQAQNILPLWLMYQIIFSENQIQTNRKAQIQYQPKSLYEYWIWRFPNRCTDIHYLYYLVGEHKTQCLWYFMYFYNKSWLLTRYNYCIISIGIGISVDIVKYWKWKRLDRFILLYKT